MWITGVHAVVIIRSNTSIELKTKGKYIFDSRIMGLIFSPCIAGSTLPKGNAQRSSEVSEGDITDCT